MNHRQLREYVIRPVLRHMDVHTDAAEELLILTAAAESRGGHYLHQVGGGPAVGIYQMEPATHDDIWRNWLGYKPTFATVVRDWEIPGVYSEDNASEMAGNLYYATAMARCHYLRVPKAFPAADDIEGLARYWKRFYNTSAGAGTVAKAVGHYQDWVN